MVQSSNDPLDAGPERVSVEWHQDRRAAILIEQPRLAELDSLDDQIREELRTKGTAEPFIRELIRRELELGHTERAEVINKLLGLVVRQKKPGLAVIQMGFAAGILCCAQKTGPQYAKEFGITKEAFFQGVSEYADHLGLPKTRYQRDDAARARMRASNFRHRKKAA